MRARLKHLNRSIWATLLLAAQKFLRIDGAERAAARRLDEISGAFNA